MHPWDRHIGVWCCTEIYGILKSYPVWSENIIFYSIPKSGKNHHRFQEQTGEPHTTRLESPQDELYGLAQA